MADPENVIISIKRLIGRGFGDSVVQQQLDRFAYKISKSSKGTENSLSVWLDGKEYEPEDVSAEILKKIVQNAQTYQEQQGQRERITRAVITIPAYFNDKQTNATQIAATRAGLAGSQLLPESTAAAISYGFKPNSDDVKTILVYDFGGGTFDSSMVTSAGNQFIESGKAGDLWLGGDDIDDRLIDFVKQIKTEQEGFNLFAYFAIFKLQFSNWTGFKSHPYSFSILLSLAKYFIQGDRCCYRGIETGCVTYQRNCY